jgi:hypothetical protein
MGVPSGQPVVQYARVLRAAPPATYSAEYISYIAASLNRRGYKEARSYGSAGVVLFRH